MGKNLANRKHAKNFNDNMNEWPNVVLIGAYNERESASTKEAIHLIHQKASGQAWPRTPNGKGANKRSESPSAVLIEAWNKYNSEKSNIVLTRTKNKTRSERPSTVLT